jgi:TPR repeat protein
MKKLTIILLAFSSIAYAQDIKMCGYQGYQSVEEVKNACAQYGFMSNQEAEAVVDDILEQVGLYRNFMVQECPNINNAIAATVPSGLGSMERYILYDKEFFAKVNNETNTDWGATSILAHEIGHHLNGHTLKSGGSNHQVELQADEFSGFVLAKMGASLEDTQKAINELISDTPSLTHPEKKLRLEAIETGWLKANDGSTTEVVRSVSSTSYINAEKLYNDKEFDEAMTSFKKAAEDGVSDANFYLSNMSVMGLGTPIDNERAFFYALEGHNQGSVASSFQLAKLYFEGVGVTANEEEARKTFTEGFQTNWFTKQFEKTKSPIYASSISFMYENGLGFDQNDEQAVYWIQKAAELGDVYSQFKLAMIYKNGTDSKSQNLGKAVYWLKKSAESNYAIAENELGVMYYNGTGVTQDYAKAIPLFEKAAEQGNANGQYNFGNALENGITVDQNLNEAFKMYTMSAKKGNTKAQSALGMMYFQGKGIPIDLEEAEYWFKKASEKGDPIAQSGLGLMYETGTGLDKNVELAFSLYQDAAEKGDAQALNNLAKFYENGIAVDQNLAKAAEYYEESALKDYTKGQTNTGRVYHYGIGKKINKKQAVYWYTKASEKNDPNAQYYLGEIYSVDAGAMLNYQMALDYYFKAANNNHPRSHYRIGKIYFDGVGVEEDSKKAINWYMKGSDLNDIDSQYALGYMFQEGDKVKRDYEKAVIYFTEAANQGNMESQYYLGALFEKGKGTEKSKKQAVYWYRKAAMQGHEEALRRLKKMDQPLNPKG